MDDNQTTTSPLTLAVAWLVVTIPLGWGVYKSVVNSLPLFQASAAPKPNSTSRGSTASGTPSSDPPRPVAR